MDDMLEEMLHVMSNARAGLRDRVFDLKNKENSYFMETLELAQHVFKLDDLAVAKLIGRRQKSIEHWKAGRRFPTSVEKCCLLDVVGSKLGADIPISFLEHMHAQPPAQDENPVMKSKTTVRRFVSDSVIQFLLAKIQDPRMFERHTYYLDTLRTVRSALDLLPKEMGILLQARTRQVNEIVKGVSPSSLDERKHFIANIEKLLLEGEAP